MAGVVNKPRMGGDDAFQSELGLSMLDLLDRSTVSGCWAPLQKQETKMIGGGSLVASPMPKLVLFGGREYQLLRE